MTTHTGHTRMTRSTGALLATLAAVMALLAVGAGTAAAAPATKDAVTGTCWKDVVNDWLQHQPNVVGSYPIACYTQAIQHLDAYPDIQQYSNAPDDIHRALLAAIQNNRGGGGPGSSGSAVGPVSGGSSGGGGGGGSSSSSSGSSSSPSSAPSTDKSFVTRVFDAVGPGNAQSIPLPLLVLGGLALLLLLAAAATWIAKRVQARKMTPAPARVPGSRSNS